MMTRRQILAAAGSAACMSLKPAAAQTRPRMGGTPSAFSLRARASRQGSKPFDIVEHCHNLGLGGVETSLGGVETKAFREKVEALKMQVVLNTPLPRSDNDLAAFDSAVSNCKEAGAIALHAAMTARRYEQFDSLDAFKKSFEQNQKTIALAEPILRKHRIRLAIENHKGWRAAEQAAWLKRLGSEWVGVCYDFGNNLLR